MNISNEQRQGKLHEECAVFGVSVKCDEAVGMVHNGLLALQHRGQEGAGIAALVGKSIQLVKNEGLVSEVFTEKSLRRLPNTGLAIGHTRYSTTGNNTLDNVQPFLTEYLTGRLATAHNGNIMNSSNIRNTLIECGLDFRASSDSEVISSLIAYKSMKKGGVVEGIISAARELKGAFCLVVLSSDNKIIAVRDSHGFRPLCLGVNEYGVAVSSESVGLDSSGFKFLRDVEPGEVVVIQNGEIVESRTFKEKENTGLCIFEYVYFARPDSIIDGLSVYEARYNMGMHLAKEFPVEADVVSGVPDSGLEAAMGYAKQSGLPYVSCFVKNRYIGRSFICPTQMQRETAVKLKLNPLKFNVEGKRIVLVDDSIVRGTTSEKIIKLLREAGAKEIHMMISYPPFLHTCYYGTDIGDEENLIANRMSLEDIRKKIGVDSLGFISLEGLKDSCKKCKLGFCTGCANGDYKDDVCVTHKDCFEND